MSVVLLLYSYLQTPSGAPQDVFQVRLLSDNSERQLHRSAVQVKLETSKAVEAHVKALQGGDCGYYMMGNCGILWVIYDSMLY